MQRFLLGFGTTSIGLGYNKDLGVAFVSFSPMPKQSEYKVAELLNDEHSAAVCHPFTKDHSTSLYFSTEDHLFSFYKVIFNNQAPLKNFQSFLKNAYADGFKFAGSDLDLKKIYK